ERRSDGMYLGRFDGTSTEQLFVAVKSDMADALLRERVPRLLKIADWAQIYDVVKQSRHGVRTELEWKPSAALPLRPDTCFFRVCKEGPLWKAIETSATIALYLPSKGDWTSASVELYAIEAAELA